MDDLKEIILNLTKTVESLNKKIDDIRKEQDERGKQQIYVAIWESEYSHLCGIYKNLDEVECMLQNSEITIGFTIRTDRIRSGIYLNHSTGRIVYSYNNDTTEREIGTFNYVYPKSI